MSAFSLVRARRVQVAPHVLREWFCDEMGKLGVPDQYVDELCRRAPNSVLAKRYSDCLPEKLKKIHDKARLMILS